MSINTIQQVDEIFNDNDFLNNYDEYLKSEKVSQLKSFLDGIE